MIEPDLSLQKPLEDYVEYLGKLNLRSLPLLGSIAHLSLAFQDPYHAAQGIDATAAVFAHRFNIYPDGAYRINDFVWGRRPATAYLYWSFRFTPKSFGKKKQDRLALEGMSEVMFSPDGRIFSHSEFWGPHENFNVKAYKRDVDHSPSMHKF